MSLNCCDKVLSPGGQAVVDRLRRTCQMALSIALLAAMAACSSLPSSGPTVRTIIRGANGPAAPYRVVNLASLPADEILVTGPQDSLSNIAQDEKAEAGVDQIRVGDVLQVTIYEIGSALFGPSAVPSLSTTGLPTPVANAQAMPLMPVEPDGSITVPYVGRIQAAGRSPQAVKSEIELGLRGKSQSPQVVVTVHDDIGNTVIVMGDIHSPGRKPLSYQRERLLDMIAIAGGPSNGAQDSRVRITRNAASAEMPLDLIKAGSADDITLRPQDRIEIIHHPRSFTAFGASGRVSDIPFQTSRLSLAEALARVGGPSDAQADPSGVFLFRAGQKPGTQPVLYRIDLRNPSSYFAAQKFTVEDKDLIFIANAGANMWSKLLAIVNNVVTPVVTGKQLSR